MKKMIPDGYKFSFGKTSAEATPKFTSIEYTSNELASMRNKDKQRDISNNNCKSSIKNKLKIKISCQRKGMLKSDSNIDQLFRDNNSEYPLDSSFI